MYEAQVKVGNILNRFDNLVRRASESGRSLTAVENMLAQVKQIQESIRRQIRDN
jgi:hypothetical protein